MTISLNKACKKLGIPYQSVYSSIHRYYEAFGIEIVNQKHIRCDAEKIDELVNDLKNYRYVPRSERGKSRTGTPGMTETENSAKKWVGNLLFVRV